EKRVEMSVLLQTGRDEKNIDQDVEADRLLSRFPDQLGVGKEKNMSLSDYDVIIAIDPDWSQPDVIGNLKNVRDWVGTHAGGVIFVAGPVHTYLLKFKQVEAGDISPLQTIFPVYVKDARVESLFHDASRPYALEFSKKKNFDFLKLDETGESPTAGWD